MPDVEQMTAPEVDKQSSRDSKSSGKKGNFKLNLIVIVVSQLILAGGGFMMVSKFIKPDPNFQQALQEQEAKPDGESGEQADGTIAESDHRQIYLLEDIIVNPAGTRGSRYLSVSVGVEMNAQASDGETGKGGGHGSSDTEATPSPLDAKRPQLRDALIGILSSKTIIQLTTPEDKEAIRNEILSTFKTILDPQPVYQIYFVDFVLQ